LDEVLGEGGMRRIYGVSGGSFINGSICATGKLDWGHLRLSRVPALASGL